MHSISACWTLLHSFDRICGRDKAHTKEIKIILILTKSPHSFRSTTTSRAAPTITARLGLAGPTLASHYWTKPFIKAVVTPPSVVFNVCPKLIALLIFRLFIQPTMSHLYFIYESAQGFGNIKQFFHIKMKRRPSFMPLGLAIWPWTTLTKAAVSEPTSENKPLLLVSFSLNLALLPLRTITASVALTKKTSSSVLQTFLTSDHHYPNHAATDTFFSKEKHDPDTNISLPLLL